MFNILTTNADEGNQWLNILFLIFAVLRVYLEIIKFDLAELPLTKGMFITKEDATRFHKSGLYLSLGYILLAAPFTLFT